MPSGSGSHGGSSHGGGGSHGGSSHGSSFGGGSSGGYRRGPHYTVFMGRRVYISGKRSNLQGFLSLIMMLAIFAIFFSVGFTIVNSQIVKDYNSDYEFYHAMAVHAERNPERYVIKAYADRFEYRHNTNKYRIIYHFFTGDGTTGDEVEGYSFYVYTLEEAQRIVDEGTFDLAVNQNPRTKDTDSVPLDFVGMNVEDDGEYISAKKGKTIAIAALSVSIVLVIGSVIGNYVVLKTAKANGPDETKTETQSSSTTPTPTDTKADIPTDIPTVEAPKTWRCSYCGKVQSTKYDICKQCGASRQE